MLLCDYFIYTSAKTEKREGYQIIAKTEGVTEDIIDELEDYFYPIGVNPLDFTESRSLRIITDNKLVYSIVKNIGVGYDARKGTLYNQSFIINKNDFQKINNDSRILDNYFQINLESRGTLEKINIESHKTPVRFEKIKEIHKDALSLIFKYIILNKKIALSYVPEYATIQNILAVLPPPMRIISFSTLVNQPERQPEFNFIQISKNLFYKLEKTWNTIDVLNHENEVTLSKSDSDFEYLAEIVLSENQSALENIHASFMSLPSNDDVNKLRFAIHKNILLTALDIEKKADEAFFCSTIAQNFDQGLASKYLSDAKRYSLESKNESLLRQIEVGEFALKIQNEPLSVRLIEKILQHVNAEESELRSIFLNKIIKRKKNELESNGRELLNEIISSNSQYKEDILRIYVENKFLHRHLTEFILDLQKKKIGIQPLFKTLIKISIHHNLRFLKKLAKVIKIDLKDSFELNLLKYMIDDICSNPEIQNKISLNLAITISRSLRLKIEKSLKKETRKEHHTLQWKSELNFDSIESNLTQILFSFKKLLEVISSRKLLTNLERAKIGSEIKELDASMDLIKSIKYNKRAPEINPIPNLMDLFLTFWGWKR